MARYVIFIKTGRGEVVDGYGFDWEVRELTGEQGQDISERSGPALLWGNSPTRAEAELAAETAAEALAQEAIYIYNTTTEEPTA